MTKKEKNKKYYEKHREIDNAKSKKYRETHKDKIKEYQKKYRADNKDKRKIYHINRIKIDKIYAISVSLRTLISKKLKYGGYTKKSKTISILGCSFEDFKLYIESKFEPWMNWGNRGLYNGEPNYGWDIDHIIPLSSAKTEEDVIRLNHYTNLRPLCSKVNRDVKKAN